MHSPYFTPPRSAGATAAPAVHAPVAPRRVTRSSTQRADAQIAIRRKGEIPPRTPITPIPRSASRSRRDRVSRAAAPAVPAVALTTPESLPRDSKRRRVSRRDASPLPSLASVRSGRPLGAAELERVVVPREDGPEVTDKICLAQDRLRHDPWRMLVMTTLLNKTAGRAVRPVFARLLELYPDPRAMAEDLNLPISSVPDLADLLYPLGLFNQRASSLIRFSNQYLSLSWPIRCTPDTVPLPDGRLPLNDPLPSAADGGLDATVFYGSGTYASDSLRMYSPLLPGGGGPRDEARWLGKRARARARRERARREREERAFWATATEGRSDVRGGEAGLAEMTSEGEVVEPSGYLSDEEGEQAEEEWRRVVPGDKELRRYMIWRWGLEGIQFDVRKGPTIVLERDRRRLAWLVADRQDGTADAE